MLNGISLLVWHRYNEGRCEIEFLWEINQLILTINIYHKENGDLIKDMVEFSTNNNTHIIMNNLILGTKLLLATSARSRFLCFMVVKLHNCISTIFKVLRRCGR